MNSGVPDASLETENLQSESNSTDGEYHLDFLLEEVNENCNDSDQDFIDEISLDLDIDWLRQQRREKRERDISKKARKTSILRKALNLSERRWSASQPTKKLRSEVSVHSDVKEDHVGLKVKQVKMTADSLGSASPTIGKLESEAKCVVSTNESEKNMISEKNKKKRKPHIHHKKGEKATFQPTNKDVYFEKNTELIESNFSTCSQAIDSLNKQVQDLSSRYAGSEENLKCHPIASQAIATLVSETNAETAEAMISNLVTSETEAVISDSDNMVISDGELSGSEGSLSVTVTSEVPLIMNSGVPDASPETENLQSESNSTHGEYHLDFLLEEVNENCNDSEQEFIDEIHFADIDWLRRKRSEKRERDISKKARRTSILRIKALNLSESRWSASQPTSEVSVRSKTEAVISTVSEDHVGVKVKQVKMTAKVKMTANSLGSASPTIGKLESEAKCVVSANVDTEAVISESKKNMISDGELSGLEGSLSQNEKKRKPHIHRKKGEKATFQPRKKDVFNP